MKGHPGEASHVAYHPIRIHSMCERRNRLESITGKNLQQSNRPISVSLIHNTDRPSLKSECRGSLELSTEQKSAKNFPIKSQAYLPQTLIKWLSKSQNLCLYCGKGISIQIIENSNSTVTEGFSTVCLKLPALIISFVVDLS